jgi:hypothetical protein
MDNRDRAGPAEVVVTMGRGDSCLLYPGKPYEDGDLEDRAWMVAAAVHRPIRDEIRRRVKASSPRLR